MYTIHIAIASCPFQYDFAFIMSSVSGWEQLSIMSGCMSLSISFSLSVSVRVCTCLGGEGVEEARWRSQGCCN